MTVTRINDFTNRTSTAGTAAGQERSKQTDIFQNIMQQAYSGDGQRMQQSAGAVQTAGSSKALTADNTSGRTSAAAGARGADNRIAQREKPQEIKDGKAEEKAADTKIPDLQSAAEETEKEVLEKTGEALGLTREELLQLLQQLNMTPADLMLPENLAQVVSTAMGDGELSALAADETLLTIMQSLNVQLSESTEAIMEKYGITKQQLADALAGAEAVLPEAEIQVDAEPEFAPEESMQELQIPEERKTEDRQESMQEQQGGGKGQLNQSGEGVLQTTPFLPAQDAEAAFLVDGELSGAPLPSAREIMEQMLGQMRSRVTTEVSQLQMQLNPENLGTVNLTISMKEGHMTAHFATQNEEVRAAIESQIAVLKENLEQQGVKIEAVEVTVGSHAFERNLEQGNDSDRQQEDAQEKLRKATRKIDLGGYGQETGQIEEQLQSGEEVTVDMMQADGNRMDYKI